MGTPPPRLKAPFPWPGGKSRAAPQVWGRLGRVQNVVEPFAGSLALLLGNPAPPAIETVNDSDGLLCNVWRALTADPAEVARWADWPASEPDLHARHLWLRARREALTARLMADPDYYDAKIAGWWLWGISLWIGSGWCTEAGAGPWGIVEAEDGTPEFRSLGDAGRGVKRKRIHLGNAGRGVSRKRIHLGHAGQGVSATGVDLLPWFAALQQRLRRVRVCCGDWSRVMGPSVTYQHGLTGVLLDPPYSTEADRHMGLYSDDDGAVAHAVRAWCLDNGDNPLLRIVLCGYADEGHEELEQHGWSVEAWTPNGGLGNQGQGRGRANKQRERLWFSPHCLRAQQGRLFD